jgi:predicted permease
LQVRDPASLVLFTTRNAGSLRSMSHPSFLYFRDHTSTLAGVAAFRTATVNVGTEARTERVDGMLVSGDYFDVLGVRMAGGAGILAADDRTPRSGGGRGLVAVLGHEFWRQRFSADPGIIGQPIRVNGQPVTVVGVSAPGFTGTVTGSIPAVYLPMMFAPHIYEGAWLENPRNLWLRMIGRLRPGTSVEQAQTELTHVFRQFYADVVLPVADGELTRRRAREAAIVLEPGQSGLLELGDTVRPTLLALLGLVALVLATACINVAGLMVARTERLQRDTAICLALGAARGRLWSRSIAESLTIGMAGVCLGLLVAVWLRDILAPMISVNGTLDLRLDARVVGVAVIAGVAAAAIVGALTGWTQTRMGIVRSLKGTDMPSRLRLRKLLIAGQLAFSVVVLVAAALFMQTLTALRGVPVGFDRQRIMVASTAPAGYSPERRLAFYQRLVEEVSVIPGVHSVALAGNEPMAVNTGWSIRAPGSDAPASASVMFVSPRYFETMGISLLRGRDFTARDIGSPGNPVIVNENFVRTYLGGQEPIGMRFGGNGPMIFEIVGVARDSAAFSLRDLDQQLMYVPSGQGVLHVRAAAQPKALQAAIEDAVRRIDAGVPVFGVRTIEQVLDRFLTRERTLAVLSSTFGLLALVLVAVGVYGLVSNAVSRRTRELGIRLALGAGRARIAQMILRDAVLLVVGGCLAGVPLVLAVGRFVRTLLFGVQPIEWTTLAAAFVLLTLVGGMAAWLPARRAARLDPVVALKAE